MRKLGFGGGADTNFGIGGGAGPSGSAYCANNEPWPPALDKAPGNTEGAAPLRLNCACAASCSLDTLTPGGGAPGPVFGRPAKMPGGGAMPGGGGGGAAPGLNPGGRAPRRCAMLFMIAARSAPAGCSARLGPTALNFYALFSLSEVHWARCHAVFVSSASTKLAPRARDGPEPFVRVRAGLGTVSDSDGLGLGRTQTRLGLRPD